MRTYIQKLIIVLSLFAVPLALHAQAEPGEESTAAPNDVFLVTVTHGSFSSEIITTPGTISEILKDATIELNETEFTTISEDTFLSENSKITIKEPVPIRLLIDGTESKPVSKASSVENFLTEQEISLNGEDYTNPSLSSPLLEDQTVEIVRKKTETETIQKAIPFGTEKKYDNSLTKGKQSVEKNGREGSKKVTYEVIYENNDETSRAVISEKILEKSQDKVIIIGTKEPVIEESTTGDVRSGSATYYYGPTNAASHVYPRGSVIKITNNANGKSITVTIDDYGGFGNRLVDLRQDHFEKIGNISTGVLSVTVERIQ